VKAYYGESPGKAIVAQAATRWTGPAASRRLAASPANALLGPVPVCYALGGAFRTFQAREIVPSLPETLWRILKHVSRSFALSIAVLPPSLRGPIGLAYLLARAADTIADTRIVPRPERLRCLDLLRQELDLPTASRLTEITADLTGPQRILAERELLARLPECIAAFGNLRAGDRAHVRSLLLILIEGMQADLRAFPGEDAGGLAALESRGDLDRYTYSAAGCVGEFWTDMVMAHRSACRGWDAGAMRRLGVRFGQALQLTNVIRDLAQDLRIGRCYLPRQDLAAVGLRPSDLLEPSAIARLRPTLRDLLNATLACYDDAWAYTRAIPRREWRVRLACAWPMLIGLQTLERIGRAENLLDPRVIVKIARPAVYRILLSSTLRAWSNAALHRRVQVAARRARAAVADGAGR
jgi:farnesyl-diphosphate farnesyltransferase